jgi:hypothetical protein
VVQGQIYLGSEEFVEQHQPDQILAEIPRKQTQAKRPSLKEIFARYAQRCWVKDFVSENSVAVDDQEEELLVRLPG